MNQLICDAIQDRHQIRINAENLRPAVVDDVDQLFGKEPRVHRMKHKSGGGNAEIQFQVRNSVPREGRDPVAPLQTHAGKGARNQMRPLCNLAPA